MSNPVVVDLFVEDSAHEEFLKAMLNRLAHEEGKPLTVRVRSARGGHGRALTELSLYQKSVLKASGDMTIPDLLVIAIDANCKQLNLATKEIDAKVDTQFSRGAPLSPVLIHTLNAGTSPIRSHLCTWLVPVLSQERRNVCGTTTRGSYPSPLWMEDTHLLLEVSSLHKRS